MEPEIKRVSYFDGQFLKQGEFNDEGDYARHMRRRQNYMLFRQSGVIPLGGTNLVIEPLAAKQIRVRAGTALTLDPTLMEGREIVLHDDTAPIDLTALGLGGGGTAYVYINYEEVPGQIEPSDFGGTFPSRVTEQAHIRVLTAPPAILRDSVTNEELILLGTVAYDTMTVQMTGRLIATLRAELLGVAPGITIDPPTTATAGTSITLHVVAQGGFNLTGITAAGVTFDITGGITNKAVANNIGTSMDVTFDLSSTAATGPRTLRVNDGATTMTAQFNVIAGLTLISFTPVNVPGGVTFLAINGTGFAAPVTVAFSDGLGGFIPAVNVPAGNVSATQIRVDIGTIPNAAGQGVVTVNSNGTPITSGFPVTPPAVINAIPAASTINALITITGARFYAAGLVVGFGGGTSRGPASPTPFPNVGFGESIAAGTINVRVPPGTVTGRITVTTSGGTVQSGTNMTI